MQHNDTLISPKINQHTLERLAHFMGVCLYKLNLVTKDIALNLNTTQITGHSLNDLPNNIDTKDSMIHPSDRELVNNSINSIINGQKDHYHIEYRLYRKDGSIVWVEEVGLITEYDSDGHPSYMAALALDLSRLRWAEEKARNLDLELKTITTSLDEVVLAEENRLLKTSNAAAAMIIAGFHQDYEVLLHQALQILGESVQADYTCIWRNKMVEEDTYCFLRARWTNRAHDIETKRSDTLFKYDDFLPNWHQQLAEHKHISGDGKVLPRDFIAANEMSAINSILLIPLYLHGEFWGTLGFLRESNVKFKSYEAKAILSGAIIIASSVSRNETFGKINMAREQAVANTLAKGEFLSRMSHELRTPLNAIIGMTGIAIREKDPSKIKEHLKKVEVSSQLLLNIINDVLDISKIDAGKLEIIKEPFNLHQTIKNAENVVKFKLDEKKQRFTINIDESIDREIISDEHRLTQVIVNLLNNATKFTPQEGEISLTVKQKNIDKDKVRILIEIRDNGIGLSYQQQEKLFTAFEQADVSITRKYGGTGLGLAICKKILNMLGGDIWVKSKPGQGSCFFFEIEAELGNLLSQLEDTSSNKYQHSTEPLLSCSSSTEEEKINDWQDKTILLADDVELNREIVEIILADTNVRIISVENGVQALEAFTADPNLFDVILMDVQMPIMDGLTATKKIRELAVQNAEKVPIIAMTANAFKEDVDVCIAAGMNDHIAKPITFDIFLQTLGKYLNKN